MLVSRTRFVYGAQHGNTQPTKKPAFSESTRLVLGHGWNHKRQTIGEKLKLIAVTLAKLYAGSSQKGSPALKRRRILSESRPSVKQKNVRKPHFFQQLKLLEKKIARKDAPLLHPCGQSFFQDLDKIICWPWPTAHS
jgi:hypothetical protein